MIRVAVKHAVLFLCTGNSARSILAEALLNCMGAGAFTAYSAGSHPRGEVHPEALATLQQFGVPTEGLRSKSWDEFSAPGASPIDFVITVCDNAAREACPAWPGHPRTAHWGLDDPAALTGPPEAVANAFRNTYLLLQRRIQTVLMMPVAMAGVEGFHRHLQALGQGVYRTLGM